MKTPFRNASIAFAFGVVASAFAISGVATVTGSVNAAAHGLWRLAQQAGLTTMRRPGTGSAKGAPTP